MSESASSPQVVNVNQTLFDAFEIVARTEFGSEVDELSFSQASIIVRGILILVGQTEPGQLQGTLKSAETNRLIVDSVMDGEEATKGMARKLSDSFLPSAEVERQLVLNVVANLNGYQQQAEPEILATYTFVNQPSNPS